MDDLGAGLSNVGEKTMRLLLGNRAHGSVGLAMHGANFENVLTTFPIDFSVMGIISTAAARAEVDISTLVGLPSIPLLDGQTQYFGFQLTATDAMSVRFGEVRQNEDLADGSRIASWPVAEDEDNTLVAVLAIDNRSGADFVLGTTLLSTAGLTVAYLNISVGH